jgi:hypothetical protein
MLPAWSGTEEMLFVQSDSERLVSAIQQWNSTEHEVPE